MTIVDSSKKWIQCPPLQAILAAVVNQARPGKKSMSLWHFGNLLGTFCIFRFAVRLVQVSDVRAFLDKARSKTRISASGESTWLAGNFPTGSIAARLVLTGIGLRG